MGWILIIVGIILISVVLYSLMFARSKDSNNPAQRKTEVSAKYSTDMTRYAARKETTAATARSGLLVATNQEQALLDENAEREADLDVKAGARQVEINRQQTDIVKLQNAQLEDKYRIVLTQIALQHQMDVPTYLQVHGHRQMKQIDLEARSTEYKQDQEQISRVQQEKLELIDRATQRLFGFYEQRKQLEKSKKPADKDKLDHLNKLIDGAERLILGEQDRFIQSTLGQEASRSLPAHDGGTSDTAETEEDQE
jgi:type III secretory pathway component EscV